MTADSTMQAKFPDQSPSQEADEFDLQAILRVLSRRRWAIISVSLTVLVLSVLTAFQLVPRYTAEAVLMLDIRKSQVVNIEAVMSGLSPEAAAIRSEVDVLSSRTIAAQVVDRLKLATDPEFNPALRTEPSLLETLHPRTWIPESWRAALGGAEPEAQDPEILAEDERTRLVDAVRGGFKVSTDGRSYSLRISYTSLDPRKAARITNAFAEVYLNDQLEAKFEATRRANDWLSTRLTELQEQVRVAENSVQLFREQNNLIQARGATVSGQQLTELNSQLVIARTERGQAEARLRAAQRATTTLDSIESAAEVMASPLIQRLREQESQVRRKEAELSNRYGARHPTMINVRAELADLQQKIGEEVRRIVQSLANQLDVARAKEQSLQASLSELEGISGDNSRAEVQLRELERQAEANRVLYENFLGRSKETREQQDLQTADARLISEAVPPVVPSFPNKKLIVALGALGGLFLGLLAAFALERLDRGFRGAEQVEALLHSPVLAQVPSLAGRTKQKPEEYVLEKPMSSFAEALRSLRTALHYSNVDKPPKVIVVTSTIPREGKSTLCLCFARAAAKAGSRVLLIDADLRRPRIAKAMGVEAKGNLAELLAGEKDAADVIQIDELSGAHMITARPDTPNPQDLLSSRQMEKFITGARDLYDIIIIDTPPVLAVSDAAAVSKIADVVLYVVHWGSTKREMVVNGMKQLRAYNAPVAGVVLSQVDLKKHARYGYGDYGYYYGKYREYYQN